jgi:hypothetical protein
MGQGGRGQGRGKSLVQGEYNKEMKDIQAEGKRGPKLCY